MPRLNTKLRREIVTARWQFLAVAATVMLGIAFFQGSLVSYANLSRSYDLTYRRLAFGDVWVRMAGAPDTLVRRASSLPGARAAVGRIVEEIRVAQPGRRVRQVMGRIISLPPDRQPDINRVRVVAGRYFSPQGGREALLELSFARAHSYRVGEFIYPTIQGEEIRFRVVGLVQSPEYIYSVQSEQYLVPTPDTFGVIFIPHPQAESLLDMAGVINEICITTHPAAREQAAAQLRTLTDRYGGEEPVTRDNQPSNKLLMMDLEGYQQMAVIFPLLFLTAAALTTYTLLARTVQSQRAQIGVLRAMGFTQRSVLGHFLWLGLLPALAGGFLGIGLGYLFAWLVTRLYVTLIHIPFMSFQARPDLSVVALLLAVASCLVGALSPARAAARLPPAVAMTQQEIGARPLSPGLRWLGRGLPLALKLPLRNLLRRPRRTAYTVVGIALGVALTVLSFAMLDSVEQAIGTYFEETERYDLGVGFDQEQPGSIVSRIQALPGVWLAEPTLEVPVEIRRRGRLHKTVLAGLSPNSQLRRLTTTSGRPAYPAPGEVLLGSLLRKKFGVGDGDWLHLSYAQNRRDFRIVRLVRVGPAITQPIGSTVYMRMDDLHRLFAERLGQPPNSVSGVLVRADPSSLDSLRRRLYRMSMVAAIQTRAQTHHQIEELTAFTKAFTGILAFFGIGLAFAVVFTAVSITVLERTRELATLRTIGFDMRRIAWLTTAENLLLAAIGLALGLPLGRWLDIYLMTTTQSEYMSLEPVIFARTYLIAAFGLLVMTLLSQLPSLRRIRRTDLAAATKEIAT